MLDASVVVLICIFGSGLAVLLAYAFAHRFYAANPSGHTVTGLEDGPGGEMSQAAYMREVRLRNYEGIAAMTGLRGKGPRVLVESMSDASR